METGSSKEEDSGAHERVMLELLQKAQQERDDLKAKLKSERDQNMKLALDVEALRKDLEKLNLVAKLERVARAARNVSGWVGMAPPDTITLGAVRVMVKELDQALSVLPPEV